MMRERIAHVTIIKWHGITHGYAEYTESEWNTILKRRKANKVAKKQRKLNHRRKRK